MAFSKTRSMTPLSRSSVLMVRSVTCFISWLNICGVNLLRILRTFRKSSCKNINEHITECAPRQQSITPFPLHIRESNDVINYSIIAEHLATTTCFLLQNKAIWNMHMFLIRTSESAGKPEISGSLNRQWHPPASCQVSRHSLQSSAAPHYSPTRLWWSCVQVGDAGQHSVAEGTEIIM